MPKNLIEQFIVVIGIKLDLLIIIEWLISR